MRKDVFKGITLMNVFLCFCVVMIHLTSSPLGELERGSLQYIFIFVINKLLCFSVPSFIFLSGFKLYSKYGNEKINLKEFFQKRVKKIIIPYIISVFIYFIYFYSKRWVSIRDLPEYIFLGTLAAHFYYIVIAVQLYVLFPLLKSIFNKSIPLTTALALACTVFFQQFLYFEYSDRFAGSYIFYFVLGMLFAKHKLCERKYFVTGLLGFLITAIPHLSLSYMAREGVIIYRYAEIANIIYVTFSIISIYGACIRLSEKYNYINRCAKMLGSISYNVYLYHILVIFMLEYDVFSRFSLSVKAEFASSFIVIYSLIFIYGFLNRKNNARSRQNG